MFPENIDAFRVLVAVESQWEMPGMSGGRCAVALTECEAAMRMLGIKRTPDLFQRLHLMIARSRSIRLKQQAEAIERSKRDRK